MEPYIVPQRGFVLGVWDGGSRPASRLWPGREHAGMFRFKCFKNRRLLKHIEMNVGYGHYWHAITGDCVLEKAQRIWFALSAMLLTLLTPTRSRTSSEQLSCSWRSSMSRRGHKTLRNGALGSRTCSKTWRIMAQSSALSAPCQSGVES